jgi:hypothetical protein
MLKKLKTRLVYLRSPLLLARAALLIGVIALVAVSLADPKTTKKPSNQNIITKSTAQKSSTTEKAKTTTPASTASTVTTTVPAAPKALPAAAKPVATTTSKPSPIVVPSPQSSVTGLTPTSPTSSSGSSSSGGSSGSGSGSSSSGSGSSATTTTSYSSYNWSGYLSTDGIFTSISGSWMATSPTAEGRTNSADATWIGIGGVSTSDLIQIGTQNTVSPSGVVSSAAFYELLPGASQTVPGVTVSPGDSMSATITQVSGSTWSMTITDNTNGQSYTNNFTYSSSLSSAEWIEEDPSYSSDRLVPFDNYGTTTFAAGSTTKNGVSQSIYSSSGDPITMINKSNQTLSSPSNLNSGGSSFTATRENG